MSEYLKRVHKRLVARAMRADDDKWITINGTHVLVGEGGDIKKGPSALKEEGSWKDTAKRAKKNKAKAKNVSLSRKAEVFNHLVDDDYKAYERRERENRLLNNEPKKEKFSLPKETIKSLGLKKAEKYKGVDIYKRDTGSYYLAAPTNGTQRVFKDIDKARQFVENAEAIDSNGRALGM